MSDYRQHVSSIGSGNSARGPQFFAAEINAQQKNSSAQTVSKITKSAKEESDKGNPLLQPLDVWKADIGEEINSIKSVKDFNSLAARITEKTKTVLSQLKENGASPQQLRSVVKAMKDSIQINLQPLEGNDEPSQALGDRVFVCFNKKTKENSSLCGWYQGKTTSIQDKATADCNHITAVKVSGLIDEAYHQIQAK